MKRWKYVALCALAVPLAWAAPNPARVPANADLVIVGDRLDQGARFADAQKEALRKAGVDVDAFSKAQRANLEACSKNVQAMLKAAFGFSDDWETWTTRSSVFSLTLPERLDNPEADFAKAILFFAVENPKADFAAFDAAVRAEAATSEQLGDMTFSKSGAWTVLRDKEPDPNLPDAFLAWRALPDGIAFAMSGGDFAKVAALAEGKGAAVTAESPLAAAFQAPKGTEGPWINLMVRDVSDLVKRSVPEETLANPSVQMAAGWQKDAKALRLACWQEADKQRFVLTLRATDAAAATKIRDSLLGMKAMFAMMLAQPQAGQSGVSPFAKWFNEVSCEARGDVVTLDLSMDYAQLAAVLKIAQSQAGDAEDEEPEDEDEPLSEEEAKATLDGLETL